MRRVKVNRPHGQAVKTSPFHGGNSGSSPDGVTKQVKGEPVSIKRRIRFYRLSEKKLVKTSDLLYYMI